MTECVTELHHEGGLCITYVTPQDPSILPYMLESAVYASFKRRLKIIIFMCI